MRRHPQIGVQRGVVSYFTLDIPFCRRRTARRTLRLQFPFEPFGVR
jgi:hypothetical protein